MSDINEPTEAQFKPEDFAELETRLLAGRRVSSAPSFADVRVKPLEWVERTQDRGDGTSEPSGDWEALATTGSYYIELLGDRWSLQRDDYTDLGVFDSPDEAKAAAQADYEQRIRSALDNVPAPSFADGIEAPSQASPNWNGWRSIDTAPEDCRVILGTAGNWVGEAIMLRDEDTGEQIWTWVDTGKPSLHSCYGWMPLPEPLLVSVLSDLRPDGFDGPTGAE